MILIDENYWDCECKTRFIHPKSHEACNACFSKKEDQPDSMQKEIMEDNIAGEDKEGRIDGDEII